ncbi:MAG: class I SAM-dependent methyltransferase [Pseudomonadaceae bacterium]|nr:class I SAM-dependent methyltransferase [Pseudomonadaceae bacterium]
MEFDELLPLLRCPATHGSLVLQNGELTSAGTSYPLIHNVPDLRRAPDALNINAPWYEPWEDLETVNLDYPPITVSEDDLPKHLDRHLASIAGEDGRGRTILEIGCGARQCETWFEKRNFRYVGSDIDFRGAGPHVMADAHNLPFNDNTFDFVTSMAVSEHLISPITAAQEIFRVLKPGGVYFGTSAFVYCFHDKASFHHMSHAGLLYVLRVAGFNVKWLWPDWFYQDAIPEMGFRGTAAAPWRVSLSALLKIADWTFLRSSNLARRLIGKPAIDEFERQLHLAGSVSFAAHRPD